MRNFTHLKIIYADGEVRYLYSADRAYLKSIENKAKLQGIKTERVNNLKWR